MIDQIKNKTVNTSVSNAKASSDKTNQVSNTVSKVNNPDKTKTDAYNGKVSQFITKEKIKSMSKEPPIDKATTSRIKEAIKNGNYPLDLSKVADALFDAYKEMK
tara:strand:- start:208 stop:519 length:312 start_codon:yes stop_codon:yes gene_type:complete